MHRQVLDRLAPRLVVEARAPDGTVEAVRVADARAFAFGVQWHPEYWAATDPAVRRALPRLRAMRRGSARRHAPSARGGVDHAARTHASSRPSGTTTTHEGSHLDDIELRVRALETLLDRERLCRPGRARRLHRDLRDEGRPAQRRQGRRQGLERSGLSAAGCCEDATAAIALARLHRPPGRAHGGAGEHAGHAQHGRLHALLLLSVDRARAAAGLVQVAALPLARRHRSARRARRVRRDAARGDEDPRLGFHRRDPLPRGADAAGRHGRRCRRRSSPISSRAIR